MVNRNTELKSYIKGKKVPQWMIAERMGVHDSGFSRMLRYSLSNEKVEQIKAIADELEKEFAQD